MKLSHVLVAGLVACGLVFAQEATTTTAPAAENAPMAKAKVAKKTMPKIANGEIVSIDAIANIVIVKTRKAEDTLTVIDKTVIKDAKGKVVALADLKAETRVSATYKVEDGKMIAIAIKEKPAAAPVKAPKAPKAVKETAPAAPTSGATRTPDAK